MDIKSFQLGRMLARYLWDKQTGAVGLALLPASRGRNWLPRRKFLGGVEIEAYADALGEQLPACQVDSLVQVSVAGDDGAANFSQGRTMRNSATVERLRFEKQAVRKTSIGISIRTTLSHPDGWFAHHDLGWKRGTSWLDSTTIVENTSEAPITLEMLASFSLSGITPFAEDDAPGRLRVHRFRSVWSMEGRLETRTLEDLQLERSWSGYGVRCERFGVIGSMPCNGFFPCAAVEDTDAGVVWGAQLEHNASWQMEFYRRDDELAFSGGLADREFGHWTKRLMPGESFASPKAFVACVAGTLDDCCASLVSAQEPALKTQPKRERSLPVVFNEWATTWGKPSHENMVRLAEGLRGLGITYLVMDAGWYAPPNGLWNNAHGDWVPCGEFYPAGLSATADAIRKAGFVPGIWFEMETCGRNSEAFSREGILVHRDGKPLTIGNRRFFDFRKKDAFAHWEKSVPTLLRDAGFEYLKVDYNETTGIGFDGAESPGESQRQMGSVSLKLFERLRSEFPNLVIENCSSGGQRLVPPCLATTAMSSFSDAHECLEIPLIAANLHRLMLPRQSQIWAVLRSGESEQRTNYSLASGFLGRLCLSGDALQWSDRQRELVSNAIALYKRVAPIIRDGVTRRFGPEVPACRHPEGWQCIVRTGRNGELLAVAHIFAKPGLRKLEIPLPPGRWSINAAMGDLQPIIRKDRLLLEHCVEFAAQIVHLRSAG